MGKVQPKKKKEKEIAQIRVTEMKVEKRSLITDSVK